MIRHLLLVITSSLSSNLLDITDSSVGDSHLGEGQHTRLEEEKNLTQMKNLTKSHLHDQPVKVFCKSEDLPKNTKSPDACSFFNEAIQSAGDSVHSIFEVQLFLKCVIATHNMIFLDTPSVLSEIFWILSHHPSFIGVIYANSAIFLDEIEHSNSISFRHLLKNIVDAIRHQEIKPFGGLKISETHMAYKVLQEHLKNIDCARSLTSTEIGELRELGKDSKESKVFADLLEYVYLGQSDTDPNLCQFYMETKINLTNLTMDEVQKAVFAFFENPSCFLKNIVVLSNDVRSDRSSECSGPKEVELPKNTNVMGTLTMQYLNQFTTQTSQNQSIDTTLNPFVNRLLFSQPGFMFPQREGSDDSPKGRQSIVPNILKKDVTGQRQFNKPTSILPESLKQDDSDEIDSNVSDRKNSNSSSVRLTCREPRKYQSLEEIDTNNLNFVEILTYVCGEWLREEWPNLKHYEAGDMEHPGKVQLIYQCAYIVRIFQSAWKYMGDGGDLIEPNFDNIILPGEIQDDVDQIKFKEFLPFVKNMINIPRAARKTLPGDLIEDMTVMGPKLPENHHIGMEIAKGIFEKTNFYLYSHKKTRVLNFSEADVFYPTKRMKPRLLSLLKSSQLKRPSVSSLSGKQSQKLLDDIEETSRPSALQKYFPKERGGKPQVGEKHDLWLEEEAESLDLIKHKSQRFSESPRKSSPKSSEGSETSLTSDMPTQYILTLTVFPSLINMYENMIYIHSGFVDPSTTRERTICSEWLTAVFYSSELVLLRLNYLIKNDTEQFLKENKIINNLDEIEHTSSEILKMMETERIKNFSNLVFDDLIFFEIFVKCWKFSEIDLIGKFTPKKKFEKFRDSKQIRALPPRESVFQKRSLSRKITPEYAKTFTTNRERDFMMVNCHRCRNDEGINKDCLNSAFDDDSFEEHECRFQSTERDLQPPLVKVNRTIQVQKESLEVSSETSSPGRRSLPSDEELGIYRKRLFDIYFKLQRLFVTGQFLSENSIRNEHVSMLLRSDVQDGSKYSNMKGKTEWENSSTIKINVLRYPWSYCREYSEEPTTFAIDKVYSTPMRGNLVEPIHFFKKNPSKFNCWKTGVVDPILEMKDRDDLTYRLLGGHSGIVSSVFASDLTMPHIFYMGPVFFDLSHKLTQNLFEHPLFGSVSKFFLEETFNQKSQTLQFQPQFTDQVKRAIHYECDLATITDDPSNLEYVITSRLEPIIHFIFRGRVGNDRLFRILNSGYSSATTQKIQNSLQAKISWRKRTKPHVNKHVAEAEKIFAIEDAKFVDQASKLSEADVSDEKFYECVYKMFVWNIKISVYKSFNE